jgi:hypothetical protein
MRIVYTSKIHCKKELAVFPSPAGMSLIKLFLGGNNLVFSRPERVWSVTSRLGTGKWLTLFYSVCCLISLSEILFVAFLWCLVLFLSDVSFHILRSLYFLSWFLHQFIKYNYVKKMNCRKY